MRQIRLIVLGSLVAVASELAGCGGDRAPTLSQTTDNTVNLYMWADEIAPDTLPSFEKLTSREAADSTWSCHRTRSFSAT